MTIIYPVKLNTFYQMIEQLCVHAKVKNTNSVFSKKMYGNVKLTFLVCYREKLNVSYRRFVEICEENNILHMLCLTRMPHFTTLQKFVQRTPKKLFEKLVRVCRKLLNLNNIEASIDGTGFSNTNPSHHYIKRIDGVTVKNYTKTVFLADNKSKLILNVRTHSDHASETIDFIPLVKELKGVLRAVLADKGYDSMKNRMFCISNNIVPQIAFRQHTKSRKQEFGTPSKRMLLEKQFDEVAHRRRSLIESINSAIKRTLGSYVNSKTAVNQQKQVTIKAIAYNLEQIGRVLKIWLFIYC